MCTDGEISGHVNIGLVASITEGVPAIEPSHHRVRIGMLTEQIRLRAQEQTEDS
jgi:hypothetical protein